MANSADVIDKLQNECNFLQRKCALYESAFEYVKNNVKMNLDARNRMLKLAKELRQCDDLMNAK